MATRKKNKFEVTFYKDGSFDSIDLHINPIKRNPDIELYDNDMETRFLIFVKEGVANFLYVNSDGQWSSPDWTKIAKCPITEHLMFLDHMYDMDNKWCYFDKSIQDAYKKYLGEQSLLEACGIADNGEKKKKSEKPK